MRCGSLGSSQNGWSSSFGIGGSMRSPEKFEIVGKPALGHEEADELLGGRDVAAVLEDQARHDDAAEDRKGLARWAKRPFDRGRVLVVVVGPLALQRVRNRERLVQRHHNGLGEELLVVVASCPTLTDSGGVQPLR